MTIEFDADLRCHGPTGTSPVISSPIINIGQLEAPNIIDDF